MVGLNQIILKNNNDMQRLSANTKFKVVIRNNNLAYRQVEKVFAQFPEVTYQIVPVMSFSDSFMDNQLIDKKIKNIFTNELESILLNGEADLAVHSVKDLPYPLPQGLELIALLNGSDHRNSSVLPGQAKELSLDTIPLQELLAVIAISGNKKLKALFSSKDIRNEYGKVWLVGFGPGDPDLMTIKALKILKKADIIFYDDLLNKTYLKKFTAQKVYVGKRKGNHSAEQSEINRYMYHAAIAGKTVVRLKGGDPMLFAHGGEEIEYLRNRFVDVEIIPGVTSALAAAAFAHIPLTHRGIASSVTFLTGHSKNNIIIPEEGTLVYYMGASNLHEIAKKAIKQGWKKDTPVLLVYNVSGKNQEKYFTTLGEVCYTLKTYPTPLTIIIGDVVNLNNKSSDDITKPASMDAVGLT